MKIALVTGDKPHHKYFALSLYERFDVQLIFIPGGGKRSFGNLAAKKPFRYGFVWAAMKLCSLVYNKVCPQSMKNSLERNEKKYFSKIEKGWSEIPREIVHYPDTVNCSSAINLVRNKNIDVLCFLGGDIARKDFIAAANICSLNFHSGISPFYNGNKTTFHSVMDFRPNFAGGTLMYITERIDGGGILAHYLPEIEGEDTAATLFMKGIKGAVILYSDFLEYLAEHEPPKGVLQHRSFKYVRNIDWTFLQDMKLRKFERGGRMRVYERAERVLTYYHLGPDEIQKLYPEILDAILSKGE